MKTCLGCKYAQLAYTASGRLHPSGNGKCTYDYRLPELPKSMYWIGNQNPNGGYINRKNEEFEDHCAYWVMAAIAKVKE